MPHDEPAATAALRSPRPPGRGPVRAYDRILNDGAPSVPIHDAEFGRTALTLQERCRTPAHGDHASGVPG